MITPGLPGQPSVKMMRVDAKEFESVGYANTTRQLFIKFRNSTTLRFDDMPNFRYTGLLSAPRKDAYFRTYIKSCFLSKEVPPPLG
jgi:KTSC domain